MKFRKPIALLLILSLMLSMLSACGSKKASTTESDAPTDTVQTEIGAGNDEEIKNEEGIDNTFILDDIRIATGDTGNLVPWNTGSSGKVVLYAIYEPLFYFEKMGSDLYAVLADGSKGAYGGYDHEEGSNVYTMYISEGIYDSAGNPFTANDVKFCVDLYIENGTAESWSLFDHVEVVDDYTINWYYTEEVRLVGGLDKAWTTLYFTQAAYEASDDGLAYTSCGTGPYELSSYTAGSGCVLERKDDYWQAGAENLHQMSQSNVQTIHFEFISEISQLLIALQSGAIDATDSLDYANIGSFQDGGEYSDQYNVYSVGDNMNYAIQANCASKWAGDINFRLAVFYCISSEDIMAALGADSFTPTYYMGNTNYGDYDETWDTTQLGDYDYEFVSDVELAKSYLDQTSYNGETIRILCTSGSEGFADIAQIIMEMLGQIGINCEISQYDEATMKTIITDTSAWDFNVLGQAGGSYVVASLNAFYGADNLNYSHYDSWDPDMKLDALIQAARDVDGHTSENIQACLEEIINNAYQKTLFRANRNVVYSNDFTYIYQSFKGWLIPWGCAYQDVNS